MAVCLANGQSRPPYQLTGGRQWGHPGLLCRHVPAWCPDGWGSIASLMWLSPPGTQGQ